MWKHLVSLQIETTKQLWWKGASHGRQGSKTSCSMLHPCSKDWRQSGAWAGQGFRQPQILEAKCSKSHKYCRAFRNNSRNPRYFERNSPTSEPRDWKPQFGANKPNLGLVAQWAREFFEASTSASSCTKSKKNATSTLRRICESLLWCYRMICICNHLYCVEVNGMHVGISCVHHIAACPPLAAEPCTFSGPWLVKKYSKDNRIYRPSSFPCSYCCLLTRRVCPSFCGMLWIVWVAYSGLGMRLSSWAGIVE